MEKHLCRLETEGGAMRTSRKSNALAHLQVAGFRCCETFNAVSGLPEGREQCNVAFNVTWISGRAVI